KKTFLVILVLFCTNSWLDATIINIPADYETIQAGLNTATNGDTVLVATGIYYENIIWPATNGIKLIGSSEENCIIDGDSLTSVIRFEEDLNGIINTTTLITDFTIQNGYAHGDWPNDFGGGIYCRNSDPSLANVIITNNSASVGGGIYCYYSEPSFANVIITNNSASSGGGGIYCNYYSNLNLMGVKIHNNTASRGGGIYCSGSSLNFSTENRCSIYSNNTINREIGADIYFSDSGTIEVILDTFTVMNPTNYHAYPLDNFTFDIVHAVHSEQVDADLYVSPLGDNSNDGLTAETPLKTIQYANTIILANETNPHTIHLADGVYNPSTTGEFFPIEVINYVSLIGESETGVILDAENVAGVMRCEHITSSTISNMTLTNGLASSGGGIRSFESTLDLENVTMSSNVAAFSGGAIYCYESDLNLTNVTIIDNVAASGGGGINCRYNSNLSLANVTISNNTACYGGGIYCYYDSEPYFSAENKCNIYSNNSEDENGADIYVHNCEPIAVIVDTFTMKYPNDYHAFPFDNFTFDILHGAIEQFNANLYVSAEMGDDNNDGLTAETPLKTIEYANTVILATDTNPHTIYLANGIYSLSTNNESFPVTVKNYVSLVGESEVGVILDAENDASVMECAGVTSATISNMTLTNGSAYKGGGIYCFGSNPSLENVLIYENMASFGGGIYFDGSNSNLENVTISNNVATSGGGVYFHGGSPNLENTQISENTAKNGGGFYCFASSSSLESVVIYGNTAENGGGAYLDIANPSFTNVTINNNIASSVGGGIYSADYSNSNLVNCVMWSDLPEEIFGNGIAVNYSNIQGGYDGEGNIDADPLFVDAINGDFHLTEFSPCIDAGNPNSPFDPDGTIADMGAFYYHQDVGINDNELAVTNYQLSNHPNPFTGETTISFSLTTNLHEKAEITIYNVKGQKVETLSNLQITNSPNQEIIWNANNFATGVYFYKLVVDGNPVDTRKMILIK
ncbi:MAG: T9SS type A sorting domain-containing protein, partial [Candidatus Cloacimonetes bacterium]|nr:T9SS type A sorting domain-containing protein [Candidatus Cloacimonadota bacterium]